MSAPSPHRITLRDERRGPNQFSLWAYMDDEGRLHIEGQDLGPITAQVSSDGEYEYFKTFPAEHVPRIVALLDGQPGEDPIDVLSRWTDDRSWEMERRLREADVPYELHTA